MINSKLPGLKLLPELKIGLSVFTISLTLIFHAGFIMSQPAQKDALAKGNRFVPDWESQEASWVIWPTDTLMQQALLPAIKAITAEVPVNVVVANDSIRDFALLAFKNENVGFGRIRIVVNPSAKGFIRDHGPWFMFDSKNLPARAAFKWNNFGVPVNLTRGLSKQDSIVMGQFAAELTSKMKLQTLTSKLVIENGMLEINSKGVALCFMETILQRNPSFDLPEIAAELKRVLGLKKIIWLGSSPTMDKIYAGPKSANIFGYGANGHIDQFIRFANDSTILISQIDAVERKYDPVSSADYLILQENLEYLKKVTDDQDHPFNIIEIPVPAMRFHMVEDTIHDTMSDSILFRGFENGTSIYNAPMVSYLNFFICNNTLILPQYFKENLTESERAKDEKVGHLFSELFPGKQIVRVNPIPLNLKGSGIHRCFISQPAGISK